MIAETNGLQINGEILPEYEEILTPGALQFVQRLEQQFGKEKRTFKQKKTSSRRNKPR